MSGTFSLLEEGTLIQGRYRVRQLIGRGGMGAVYETRDERLGHALALKQNFYGTDERLKHAFEREARLLANLEHPALPRVTDYFTEEFGQFLVMEFVRGKDLLSLLRERGRPFPVRQVLAWADELLDALHYLHTQQPPIIHRDIKPQNLKLSARGAIMLLDFGLAKGTMRGLTSVMAGSSVVGFTPGYAPPEQVSGKGTDERSDLFSLGATLYYLLTYQTPPDAMLRLGEITNDEPDPLRPASLLNPLVPPRLSGLLYQAMALKRNDRPASAEVMRRALRQCDPGEEETINDEETSAPAHDPAPPPGGSGQRPRPLVVDIPPPQPTPPTPPAPQPVKPAVTPQAEPKKVVVAPWALLVAALYFLALVVFIWPALRIAFWPIPGYDLTNTPRPENLVEVFSSPLYWTFVAVMVCSQLVLLKVNVRVANRRPLSRRSVLLPAIVTGLMVGLLVIGAIISVYEAIVREGLAPARHWYIILAAGGLTWLWWSVVFYRLSRNENASDVITRQCRLMLKGSILELLVAVPTHIVARSKDYCCAGYMTFVGITLGVAVMLMAYGPGVFFLFVERWNRLHKYREPAGEPPRK